MMYKILRPLLLILSAFTACCSLAQIPVTGLSAHYPLDGNALEIKSDSLNGRSTGLRTGTDRSGNQGKAAAFIPRGNEGYGSVTLPVDISPDKAPVITICFWIKANETYLKMMPFRSGEKKTRGMLTEYINGAQRWTAGAGKDGLIAGPAVLKDQWTFVALIYDSPNEQARFIVNSEVFAGRARMSKGTSFITLGAFNGLMDEFMLFNRILSLQELQQLYGKAIDVNAGDFEIQDRSDYRKRLENERKSKVRTGDQFIVGYGELLIRDSIKSPNTLYVFKEGDTVTALKALRDEWFEVRNQQNQTGYISGHTLEDNCYKTGNNKTIFRFVNWLGQIFQLHRLRNWLLVALFTVILVLVVRGRAELNNWFQKIGKKDSREAFGSRSEGTPVRRKLKIPEGFFPVEWPKWWMISPGLIFGLMLIGGSFWDTGEMEWYFNEGATLIPQGFTLPIHWVLWSLTLLIFILMAALTIESISIAGMLAGLLRILMLAILNFMAIVVAFYLSVGLILAIVGFILFFIAIIALLGRRRY
ncbi:MAG: hypothetical protein IPN08_10895 [Bacteroidales bacterium]|nr:hypothetical protein [Bacteroidales bacterium]